MTQSLMLHIVKTFEQKNRREQAAATKAVRRTARGFAVRPKAASIFNNDQSDAAGESG